MFFSTRNSRRRRSPVNFSAPIFHTQTLESRQLLSADLELDTVLTGPATAQAEVEYKEKDGKASFEFRIFNVLPGDYDAYSDSTLLGRIQVPDSRNIDFEFSTDPEGPGEALLPSGLAVAKGTKVRLAPTKTGPDSNLSAEISGLLGVKGEDQRFVACVKVELTGSQGQVLKSEYESELEGTAVSRKFELAVYNLAPNSIHTVTINGTFTADIKADALGAATWMYSDETRPRYQPFPANFPAITSNTPITVGTVFSGTYSTMAQANGPQQTDGTKTLISLRGQGSLQGTVSWQTTTLPGGTRREFKVELWGGTKGTSVAVNVSTPGSNPIQIGSVVFNTKGYGRLQFDSADAARSFPANFPEIKLNTVFTVGQSLSAAYTDINQSLVPDDRSAREAYQIDQLKDFVLPPSLSENHGNKGEKWLKDKAGNWHFITPDGSLYEWDAKPGANGRRIAILDKTFHARPELLAQAKAAGSGAANDDLITATAARLDRELNLTRGSTASNNWGGLNEKWLRGNGKWYFITPDGTVTRWDGSKTATGTTVAKLDDRFHENPDRLTEAEKVLGTPEKVYAANTSLKLNNYVASSDNWQGIDVKWVKSVDNQWYFVRPNNDMYLWDRKLYIRDKVQKDVGGTFISNIAGAYTTPTMLTTPPATLPGTVASRAVLDDLFIDNPDFT